MIPAKQWYNEYPGTLFQAEHAKLVEQIQLDAYKAGMTRAAEIAGSYDDGCMSDISVNLAHKAILTERDKLKEIPL